MSKRTRQMTNKELDEVIKQQSTRKALSGIYENFVREVRAEIRRRAK